MKGLTDKYETDELHIPDMFQGTIKVCYLTVITYYDPKFNCYFIMNFFKGPLFEDQRKKAQPHTKFKQS
jgi:hypothetical protein